MNFLDHKVGIAALFGRLVVPCDGERRLFNGVFVDVHHRHLVGLQNGDLAGLHDQILLGVFDEGGDVASHEVFPVAKADQKGVFLPHADDFAGFVLADDAKGIGAADIAQRLDHSVEKVAGLLVVVVHQMRGGLGVGLRGKSVALFGQKGLELLVVFNDAVVQQRDVLAAVGVRVFVGGPAVRRPSGMSDAAVGLHGAARLHLGLKVADAAGRLDGFDDAVVKKGHA